MAAGGSKNIVLFALGANAGIAIAKFIAATCTGSSAMFSEGVHSVVDTANQALLLYGINRSTRPADKKHPFGYSKELYFWSFIVAILLFSLGAGVSLYEGIEKVRHPHAITNPQINYLVLIVAMLLEGFSTYKAVEEFNTRRGNTGAISALRSSKDPALFAVVLEDIFALAGLFIALLGVMAAHLLGYEQADGIASIVIGIALTLVAAFMSFEIKALIIGEAAHEDVQDGLRDIIEKETKEGGPILAINEIRTMHLGPEDVLVAASVDFKDGETARSVEQTTGALERAIKERFPEVRRLFLEVQSQEDHRTALAAEKTRFQT